jgi:DNA topoisomerase VI subunit A
MINCNQSSNGQLIVDDDIEIIETEHHLTFILVVEKDTVFQVMFFEDIKHETYLI